MTYVVFQGIVNRLDKLHRMEKGEGSSDGERLKEILDSKDALE